MRYYCPNCEIEIFWNEEHKGYKCAECNEFISEKDVLMVDENYEEHL